jgi:hypothetical protein
VDHRRGREHARRDLLIREVPYPPRTAAEVRSPPTSGP